MNAIKYMDELEQKGFTKEQAKASVNLWIDLMNENQASKSDLLEFKSEIKDALHVLEKKIDRLEYKLTVRLGIMMATSISLIAIIQKL